MAQLATYKSALQNADILPVADMSAGAFTTLGDGLPGYVLKDIDVSLRDEGAKHINTVAKVAKTASILFLIGQKVYFDRATGLATYDHRGNDYIGLAVASPDVTAARTQAGVAAEGSGSYVYVHVGALRVDVIEQGKTGFDMTTVTTNATVTLLPDGSLRQLLTNANEAQKTVFIAEVGVDVDDGPVFEAWVASFDDGGAAALDRDWGLASADDSDNFDDIAAFIAFHLDDDLNLDMHSDDGTTDVALADTTIDMTDDVYAFFQISLVNKAAPVCLVNGVEVTTPSTMTLAAHTGDLKAIVHMEKSADTTTGDTRCRRLCTYCVR